MIVGFHPEKLRECNLAALAAKMASGSCTTEQMVFDEQQFLFNLKVSCKCKEIANSFSVYVILLQESAWGFGTRN